MENQNQAEGQPEPKKKWYKRAWMLPVYIFGTIIVLAIIIGDDSGNSKKESPNEQPKETAKNIEQTIEKKLVEYRELQNYEKAGKTWKNIVIPSGTSQKDLIALAKELHKKDTKSYFHIFDDDAKFQEYMDWDINYGKVKDKDGKNKTIDQCLDIAYCQKLVQQQKYAYPFPEEWDNKHDIAIINEMLGSGGLKWKLSTSSGIEISSL